MRENCLSSNGGLALDMLAGFQYRHHQSQPTAPLQWRKGNLGQPWNRIGFWFGVCCCCCCWLVGSGFFGEISFVIFFILPPFSHASMTSFHAARVVLTNQGPWALELGLKARRSSQRRVSFSDREQRKLARRPDISVDFPVSGMRDSPMSQPLTLTHSHSFTHAHTYTGDGWFVRTHCSTQSLHFCVLYLAAWGTFGSSPH